MAYKISPQDIIINYDRQYQLLKVKDLPENEKPREKLAAAGPATLSLAELLAIVFGVGTKKEDVLAMASRLLKEYGEKTITKQTDPRQLEKEFKVPYNHACQLVACFELGRRLYQKPSGGLVVLKSAKQVFDYLKDLRDLKKEQFRGLYLNSRYQLIHDEVISIGSLTASIIHPREVFRPALEHSAAAIIVAHNHPSGALKASAADHEVTAKLKAAGDLLNIQLLDHIIIAGNKFASII
jgi:DNA repair protein RadC